MLRTNSYIISLAIAIALCACSHRDEPDAPAGDDSETIAFSSFSLIPEGTSSRAALSDTYTTFSVWGAKTTGGNATDGFTGYQDVMINYKLEYQEAKKGYTDTNTRGWEYVGVLPNQTKKYWDYTATSYRFFGVAPYSADYTSEAPSATKPIREIKIPVDTRTADEHPIYISELWMRNESWQYGQPVTLQFKLPYSHVEFRFIDVDGNNLTFDNEGKVNSESSKVQITDIEFRPNTNVDKIPVEGAVTVNFPMGGTYNQVTYDVKPADITDMVESLNAPNHNYAVLPTGEQAPFTIQLIYDDDYDDEEEGAQMVASVPAEFMRWEPNMKYTYVFKLTGEKMEFIRVVQVASTLWIEEDGSHEIYNW